MEDLAAEECLPQPQREELGIWLKRLDSLERAVIDHHEGGNDGKEGSVC